MKLIVDPVTCAGYGSCHELLPEIIDLDDWGFPLLRTPGPDRTSAQVPPAVERHAKRAAAACPKLALRLER